MKTVRVVLFAIATLLATPAISGVQVGGPLTELWVSDSNGTQFAWLRTSTPFTSVCGQSGGYLFIVLNEANGKELYAMALAAFMAGKNVSIGGTGTCNTIHERVRFISIAQ